MSRVQKHTVADRNGKPRSIMVLAPAPVDGKLYRVSHPEPGCSWCGEEKRVFVYFSNYDEAERAIRFSTVWSESAYCSLHCWGQDTGYCEL